MCADSYSTIVNDNASVHPAEVHSQTNGARSPSGTVSFSNSQRRLLWARHPTRFLRLMGLNGGLGNASLRDDGHGQATLL